MVDKILKCVMTILMALMAITGLFIGIVCIGCIPWDDQVGCVAYSLAAAGSFFFSAFWFVMFIREVKEED